MFETDAPTTADAVETPPEALTPDAPALAESDPADPASDGPPRDAHGRFAPRSESDAPATDAPDGADPAAEDAAGSAPPDPDAPDAPPPTEAASPTAPDVPAKAEPFSFQHRGQAYTVDGLTVAPEQAPRIAQLLARAREHETVAVPTIQRLTREVDRLTAQTQERHAEADAIARLLDEPDDERFLTEMLTLRAQLPTLRQQRLQDELQARERRIAELEGRAPPQQAPQAEAHQQIAHAIRETVTAKATQARGLPDFQGLTDADLATLLPKLAPRANLYVRAATDHDAMTYGVEPGEPVFDDTAFVEELRLLATPILTQRQREAAKASADAAREAAKKRNAALTTPTKAPPAVTTTAGALTQQDGPPRTRAEYLERKRRIMGG